MDSRRHVLQTRISELKNRWDRISRKLDAVAAQRDRETRAEEELRMDSIVNELETERLKLEAELRQLEAEFESLSHLSAATNSTHESADQTARPLNLFYCYAHSDELLRDRLEASLKLLKRQGIIKDWHDRFISPGSDWDRQINAHMESADVILLLVSPYFIASDYIWGTELKVALERHKAGTVRVIPIILRDTDWTTAPFSMLQALPKDGKPVTSWSNRDAAFADIARGIRKVCEELLRNP